MAASSNRSDTFALDDTTHDTAAVATLAAALDSQSGLSLTRARGVSFVVSAPASQVLSSGAMRCYVYAPVSANKDGSVATFRWMKHAALDLTPAASIRDWPSGDMEALTGASRITWLPDAMTVDGGTGVVLTVTLMVERHQW